MALGQTINRRIRSRHYAHVTKQFSTYPKFVEVGAGDTGRGRVGN